MSLAAGSRIGPYEIVASIGTGGMGEVYRAKDTRLGRDVAIKVSKEQFSERFEREARAVAALNHQNICTVHDVGPNSLVMELVEGPTLADRIREGPIPLDEALTIARQIADALEAAHEKGVVHRDLKPANVKIKPDGTVKVLDFGLAKFGGTPAVQSDDSPTLITAPTQMGVILGTAAYMSPEQARGKAVDKRADIWSFGVVLYEMVTGKRLFEGDDLTETLASVVKEQPDLSAAPPSLRRLLRKCLEKDPKRRLRDIGDAWELLEDARETPPAAKSNAVSGNSARLAAIVAAIFALAFAVLAWIHFRPHAEAPLTAVRFQIPAPDASGVSPPILSPDGKQVVFGDGRRLWVRALDSLDARPLSSTEGMTVGAPFWSADSRAVYFAAPGVLRKADLAGGTAQTICPLQGLLRGGFPIAGGQVVFFERPGGTLRVSGDGGTPWPIPNAQDIPDVGGELIRGAVLPDGDHFVFNVFGDSGGIFVGSLDGREKAKRILPDRSPSLDWVSSRAGNSGYLLFIRDGSLVAQPFAPKSLELSGDPISLIQAVNIFSASPSGAIIYRAGAGTRKLTWFDRQGKPQGSAGAPGLYGELALSRDGSRVAYVRLAAPVRTEIHDFATESTRPLRGAASVKPIWSPDGSRMAFAGSTAATLSFDLYVLPLNGAGDRQLLLRSGVSKYPWDWSPDGKWLVYSPVDPKTREDLWVLPMPNGGTPEPFLVTDYTETDAAFSPDGKFIAYVSDESGKFEVYVRSFPAAAGGRWTVSSGGGYQPRWGRDGKELFYFAPDGRLMSVRCGVQSGHTEVPFSGANIRRRRNYR